MDWIEIYACDDADANAGEMKCATIEEVGWCLCAQMKKGNLFQNNACVLLFFG